MDSQNQNDQQNKSNPQDDALDMGIFEIMGAENLSPEQKEELYLKMLETIRYRVIERIDFAMTDEQRLKWKELLDAHDKEGVDKYLNEIGFNVENLTIDETIKYKEEVTQHMKDVRSNAGQQKEE